MNDEEIVLSTEPAGEGDKIEGGAARAKHSPIIYFAYFIGVLVLLSILFSLLKVMAD